MAATGGAAAADDDGYGGMLTGTDEDLTSIIDLAQLEEIVREADGEEQLDPSYGPNYTDTAVTDMAHLLQSGGSSMDVLGWSWIYRRRPTCKRGHRRRGEEEGSAGCGARGGPCWFSVVICDLGPLGHDGTLRSLTFLLVLRPLLSHD